MNIKPISCDSEFLNTCLHAKFQSYSYTFFALVLFIFTSCVGQAQNRNYDVFNPDMLLKNAATFLKEEPQTLTDFPAQRSEGGIHDYYSEGPYWWEDPENPDGPYIRRDGERNPDMFNAHRQSLKRMEQAVCNLTAAYLLTSNPEYVEKAISHLDSWFVNEESFMNPSLLYAQAIKGIASGRGIGQIDVIGLINVSNAILILQNENQLSSQEFSAYRKWFESFCEWITTHPYGVDEQNNNNNHSSWWGAQVASYALLTQRQDLHQIAVEQFKSQLAIQLGPNATFPEELKRTRPFHYLNYTLHSWAVFALLTSCNGHNMWDYSVENGNLKLAFDESYNYFENPARWTYFTDLQKEIKVKDEQHLWLTYEGTKDKKFLELWSELRKSIQSGEPELLLWKYLLDNKLICGK